MACLDVVSMAEHMIRRERIKSGITKPQAMAVIARRANVSQGQIEGAIRGRVKDLKARFVERVRAAFIEEATKEINRLTHDIQIARQIGMGADDRKIQAARTAMADLQAVLGEIAP